MSDEFRRLLRATLQADDDEADRRLIERPAPPPTVCAWCPGFNPRDPANRGKSHGICPACAARLEQQAEARAEVCPTCNGGGAIALDDGDESRPCPHCGGSGTSTQH